MATRITTSKTSGVKAKIRKISKKPQTSTAKRATTDAPTKKVKNDLLASYEDLFDSIKLKNKDDIQASVLEAINTIENSKAVKKVEGLLKDFQALMIKEGTKLAKNVQKSISETKSKTKK